MFYQFGRERVYGANYVHLSVGRNAALPRRRAEKAENVFREPCRLVLVVTFVETSTFARPRKRQRHAVAVSRDGWVLLANPRAREWLRRFYPRPHRVGFLPGKVCAWLKTAGLRNGCVLITTSPGRWLSVRCDYSEPDDCAILVLELHKRRLHGACRTQGNLTRRETQILRALTAGPCTKEIAATHGISSSTVSKHIEHICRKLGAKSRTEAVGIALRDQYSASLGDVVPNIL